MCTVLKDGHYLHLFQSEMKHKHNQYQKNWVAATRALKASHNRALTTNSDDGSDDSSVYDTFPDDVYPESHVEQSNAIEHVHNRATFFQLVFSKKG